MNGDPHHPPHPAGTRLTAVAVALALLTVTAPAQARPKLTPPAPVSEVYSDADMRLHLATIPNIESPCADEECELNRAFDAQVRQLGARIAAAAYDLHPDLIKRIGQFEFTIVEKKEPGITSNASGKIVVLRGTQYIGLNEEALSFVLAREMGHIISQHHEENATTRILLSVAATLLFPALNLFGNTATVAQATSATTTVSSTTMATAAASTATSLLGTKLVLDRMKPEQLNEADQVALKLMEKMGWGHRDLAQALENSAEFDPSNAWSADFRYSIAQVQALETVAEAGEALPEITFVDTQLAQLDPETETLRDTELIDSEGNLLPPLQEAVEDSRDALPETIATEAAPASVALAAQATPALASAAIAWHVAPRQEHLAAVEGAVQKPARHPARPAEARPVSFKPKAGMSVKKRRTAKDEKPHLINQSTRNKKAATTKVRAPAKSGKPAKPAKKAKR